MPDGSHLKNSTRTNSERCRRTAPAAHTKFYRMEETRWKENIVFRAIRATAEQARTTRIRILDRPRITETFRHFKVCS